jgi:ribonuclease Z
MRPLLHANLVNGRYGDPALYVEMLFEKRALLFDLGDLTFLPPRKIHRIEHVFVSHAHVDHFIGFDVLLRVLVGREKTVHLYGPSGFIERVAHKLHSYEWNLADLFQYDLSFAVTEIDRHGGARAARFRLKDAFAPEPLGARHMPAPIVYSEPTFLVSATVLEHRTPCLAFTLQERAHVNVWRNRLAERKLPMGPWLRELKRVVIEGRPDEHLIEIPQSELGPARAISLGAIRDVVTVTPGQKIGYVTDAADTPANRQAIIDLVRGADLLFIEAAFAEVDTAIAAERAHLTTRAAGEIAHAAGARRVEPFHFSPRYQGEEEKMVAEVMAAFQGSLPADRATQA